MDESESKEFQEVMLLELTERIEDLNTGLLALEKDPTKKTAFDAVLRTLHSLKGLFSLSGYPQLSSITHSLENLVLSTDMTGMEKLVTLLFQYNDQLSELASTIRGGKNPESIHFDQLTQQLAAFDEFMVNLGNKLRISVLFSPECKVVGARSLVLLQRLKEKAAIERTMPPQEEIQAGVSFKELIIEISTQEDDETIAQIVEESQDVMSASVSRLLDSVSTTEKLGGTKDSRESLTVRVNLESLDQIIRFLGDLVISGQFIREIGKQQAYSRSFKENLAMYERTIANIQDLVIRMRLVPLETIFTRFPRMIRDLSHKEGKKINFIMTGKHIGVDRSVIEQLVNPITHLLRNAVSHGIEAPEKRLKTNKDSTGTVKLAVTHERSDIVIEIWDDGKGIDYKKIEKKAEELGLVNPGALLTNHEIQQLLFTEYISTASETTEVAGRGIGLNIVKDIITSNGGAIELDSKPGQYTSVRLIIPISVAITKVLLISVKNQHFALPMVNVEQILSVPINKILVDAKTTSRSIVVENTSVPLVDLRERLKFNTTDTTKRNDMQTGAKERNRQNEIVVLWRKGSRSLGFLVNDLLGEREVVVKPIHNFLSQLGAFSGATVLEGGQVVLIIEPMNFLEAKGHA
ncbi:MAG: chemotaxis protein CheA [Candidatus Thorarchaeota archaeon]